VIGADDKLNFLAPIQNYRSMLPSGLMGRILLAFLELFEDPVGVPFGKCPGFLDGPNSGNGGSDGAVRLHADNVAPCSAIAGKLDGDRLGADLQGILDSTAIPRRGEEEVQLHARSKSGWMHVGNTRWVYD
jgi:hypothetical protein